MTLAAQDGAQAVQRAQRFRIVLIWLFGVAASLTVLTHAAQLVHVRFQVYALSAALLTLAVTGIAFFTLRASFVAAPHLETSSLLLILGLALAGAICTLALDLPSGDDSYYVPNAVYYMQNPVEKMGIQIHYLYSDQEPFSSVFWATSEPYEYVQAVLARLSGLDFLAIYYGLATAAVGFMIPLAIFLLLTHFTDRTLDAAIGTLMALGVMLLLGERTHSYGNIALARAFQGKAVLLGLGIPLFATFSLDFFKRPTVLSWTALLALSTAMVGVSSSAVFLLPSLALALAIAQIFAAPHRRPSVATLLAYGASLLYLVLYALYTITTGAASQLGFDSPANIGWPTTFAGHLDMLINPAVPFTPIAAGVSTCLALWLLRGHQRRFLLFWILALACVFLNPIAGDLLIRYVTSPNAYWRMFYLLPFPLTVGICAAVLSFRLRLAPMTLRVPALAAACAALATAHVLLPQASIFLGPYVTVGAPVYKIPAPILQSARQVVSIAPAGPMLAPGDLAGAIVMLDSRFPQIRLREDAERVWLYSQGRVSEAELRIKASQYLEDNPAGDFTSLEKLLDKRKVIRSVVLKAAVFKREEVKALLAEYGYLSERTPGDYVLVWR